MQRLARWLLTSADRMESETLHLTQEFLAQMLGTQRSTVTVAAGEMQREGLIGYSRGKIQILESHAGWRQRRASATGLCGRLMSAFWGLIRRARPEYVLCRQR